MARRLPPFMRSRIASVLERSSDTYAEVAERFGVNQATVAKIAAEHGIVRRRRWEEHELAFLKDNYWEHGARRCAEILGRDYQVVANKANELGLSTGVGPYGRWRVVEGGGQFGEPEQGRGH